MNNLWLVLLVIGGYLLWNEHQTEFSNRYVSACSERGGRVIRMPIHDHANWIQCVKGLDLIVILPDDAELGVKP
jgi:hypothetical protein